MKIILFVLLLLCLHPSIAEDPTIQVNVTHPTSFPNRRNPRPKDCFNYFLPVMSSIAAQFERSFELCIEMSSYSRQELDGRMLWKKAVMAVSILQTYDAFDKCAELQSPMDFFECYYRAAYQNTRIMLAIAVNASDILENIKEEYLLIENEEYRCTNASECEYAEKTAAAYEQMQSCLLGKVIGPLTPPTSSTTTTTTVPEESTEEFSEKLPEEFQREFLEDHFEESTEHYYEDILNKEV